MESPSRLDFFPLMLDIALTSLMSAPVVPEAVCSWRWRLPRLQPVAPDLRRSRERRMHRGDAEGRSRCHLRVTGSPNGTSDAVAKILRYTSFWLCCLP